MSVQSQNTKASIWRYKPWWCQPWSILLTGIGLISGSWVFAHRIWLTALVAVPIASWMGYFLLIYPQQMQQSGLLHTEQDEAE